MVWWQARRVCEFCLIRMGFLLIPRHPGSPKLRMRVMEPKDYAFWRWLNIPIIIWEYDWMPRGWIDFRSCWRKKQQRDTMFKKEKKNHKTWHFAPPKDGRKVDTNFFVLKFKSKKTSIFRVKNIPVFGDVLLTNCPCTKCLVDFHLNPQSLLGDSLIGKRSRYMP